MSQKNQFLIWGIVLTLSCSWVIAQCVIAIQKWGWEKNNLFYLAVNTIGFLCGINEVRKYFR